MTTKKNITPESAPAPFPQVLNRGERAQKLRELFTVSAIVQFVTWAVSNPTSPQVSACLRAVKHVVIVHYRVVEGKGKTRKVLEGDVTLGLSALIKELTNLENGSYHPRDIHAMLTAMQASEDWPEGWKMEHKGGEYSLTKDAKVYRLASREREAEALRNPAPKPWAAS